MSEEEEEHADEDVCPFCSNSDLSCGHFAGELDCFDGGFTGGRACPELGELWDALSLAVQRAAGGGKIKLAKSPTEWGYLLQAAQEYGAAGGDPCDAVAEHLGEMLQVACDLADGPSVHSVYASSGYGGFPAEFPVQLFWTSSPGEYAEHVKRMTKAVLASVETQP